MRCSRLGTGWVIVIFPRVLQITAMGLFWGNVQQCLFHTMITHRHVIMMIMAKFSFLWQSHGPEQHFYNLQIRSHFCFIQELENQQLLNTFLCYSTLPCLCREFISCEPKIVSNTYDKGCFNGAEWADTPAFVNIPSFGSFESASTGPLVMCLHVQSKNTPGPLFGSKCTKHVSVVHPFRE